MKLLSICICSVIILSCKDSVVCCNGKLGFKIHNASRAFGHLDELKKTSRGKLLFEDDFIRSCFTFDPDTHLDRWMSESVGDRRMMYLFFYFYHSDELRPFVLTKLLKLVHKMPNEIKRIRIMEIIQVIELKHLWYEQVVNVYADVLSISDLSGDLIILYKDHLSWSKVMQKENSRFEWWNDSNQNIFNEIKMKYSIGE